MVDSFLKPDRAEGHFFCCEKLDRAVVAAAVLIVDRFVLLEIKKNLRERGLAGEGPLISSGGSESLGRARESRGERGGEGGGGEARERSSWDGVDFSRTQRVVLNFS